MEENYVLNPYDPTDPVRTLFLMVHRGNNGEFPRLYPVLKLSNDDISTMMEQEDLTQEQFQNMIDMGIIHIFDGSYYGLNGSNVDNPLPTVVTENDSESLLAFDVRSLLNPRNVSRFANILVYDGEDKYLYSVYFSNEEYNQGK